MCPNCGYQFAEALSELSQEEPYEEPKVCRLLLIVAIAVAIVGAILSIAFAFDEYGWVEEPDIDGSGSETYFSWMVFLSRLITTAVTSVLLLRFRRSISIRARHCKEVAEIRKILKRNEARNSQPVMKK